MIFEKIRERLQNLPIKTTSKMVENPNCPEHFIEKKTGEYINKQNALDIINQVEAEYNNGWIPCSERLPEPNKCCLITYKVSGVLKIAVWLFNGVDFNQTEGVEVIAWQPLPQPPEGE